VLYFRRPTDRQQAALNSAAVVAEPKKVDAKTVQRKLKPRFSTSDFIALLDGGSRPDGSVKKTNEQNYGHSEEDQNCHEIGRF
jgi:hypothetical protein